ncbi:UDP-N-acetylmuramoyl-tripeptide--D-alanyl-D-alanine ligase [Roseivirga sp. BDSF3-8]|uniref:UDP-N-acetylmuramoyl-tripeptide--D-alanyl-D- alanine ligase n=1 Tax=Roseivirga sp. BDSF3-8 TaxID=3241598 RepID=UPI003531989E
MMETLYTHFLNSTGVSTDTRQIREGNLFFALKGPNFNANVFAGDALDKGAALAVIDDEAYAKDSRYLVVDDVLGTLQGLARHHRRQLEVPVIGLTGSNGKTTTKELIREVLKAKYVVYATEGNLNNHIGVPLTLLRVPKGTEIVVVEMGANKVGDIRELCEIAEPTHGLITNIGRAHLEGFGGIEGVLRGKTELFDFLLKNKGQVFINTQDEKLKHMVKRFQDKQALTYPGEEDYYHCSLSGEAPYIKIRTEGGLEVETNLIGSYNFGNVAVALCLGKYFEVPEKDAAENLGAYIPSMNRSQIVTRGKSRIIMDAYNANPDSMRAALTNLSAMPGDRKGAILADMFELGPESEDRHREIGEMLKLLGIEEVMLCGEAMAAAAEEVPGAHYFKTREGLADFLKTHTFDNVTLLVKGSRGMKLESITEHINAR